MILLVATDVGPSVDLSVCLFVRGSVRENGPMHFN